MFSRETKPVFTRYDCSKSVKLSVNTEAGGHVLPRRLAGQVTAHPRGNNMSEIALLRSNVSWWRPVTGSNPGRYSDRWFAPFCDIIRRTILSNFYSELFCYQLRTAALDNINHGDDFERIFDLKHPHFVVKHFLVNMKWAVTPLKLSWVTLINWTEILMLKKL